jgi:hypothetical protein
MVVKALGSRVRMVLADFTGGDLRDCDAMKRRPVRDIVCISRRPGDKPAPDSQRARVSSALVF